MNIEYIKKIFDDEQLSNENKGNMYLAGLLSNNFMMIEYIERYYYFDLITFLKNKIKLYDYNKKKHIKYNRFEEYVILQKYDEITNKYAWKNLISTALLIAAPFYLSRL